MTPRPPKVCMIFMDIIHAEIHSDGGTRQSNTPACISDQVYQDKFALSYMTVYYA